MPSYTNWHHACVRCVSSRTHELGQGHSQWQGRLAALVNSKQGEMELLHTNFLGRPRQIARYTSNYMRGEVVSPLRPSWSCGHGVRCQGHCCRKRQPSWQGNTGFLNLLRIRLGLVPSASLSLPSSSFWEREFSSRVMLPGLGQRRLP